MGLRLLNVEGHRIDEVHGVTSPGKGKRVDPGSAAHIANDGRGRRQMAIENTFRAQPLDLAQIAAQPTARSHSDW